MESQSSHQQNSRHQVRCVCRPSRTFPTMLSMSLIWILSTFMFAAPNLAEDRPNVLWITAEDMSPTLGCYGDQYATTPNLDRLAEQSVRYTHAFASAPVCSPSRACLINGTVASSQGTHHMRSQFPIPESLVGFPTMLRSAGYYTTNNVKTDYNSGAAQLITDSSWNESSDTAHWRGRDADQPFFAVFNLMTSHQSRTMVWPYEQFREQVQSQLDPASVHDPQAVPLPPYYPDTPLVRQTVARYYDCVSVMDAQVGEILAQLQRDGLAENTIVFFYSDHGSGMPRHKRVLLDSGMQVPLLIRFPEKYRHLAPTAAGRTIDRLVSFDDYAPTVLALAGIAQRPDYMTGVEFLGPESSVERQYVYGHRDRIDEVIDMARSVRDKRFLYIRNYMPQLGYNQPSAWVDECEMIHDFYALAESDNVTPAQLQFVGPRRPIEELYDCQRDPLNLNNLAASPTHQKVLQRMRRAHQAWVLESRDLGFVPEIQQWRITKQQLPMEWARTSQYRLPQVFAAAQRVGSGDLVALGAGLSDADPAIRYWSAMGLSATETLDSDRVSALTKALQDDSPAVQIEAATALARHGHLEPALATLAEMLQGDDTTTILHAARAVEMLGPQARPLHADMQQLFNRYEHEAGDIAWFVRFTTTGYLTRVKP